jgi:hypothetical protein
MEPDRSMTSAIDTQHVDDASRSHRNSLVFLESHHYKGWLTSLSNEHGTATGGTLCAAFISIEYPAGKQLYRHGKPLRKI